MSRWIRRGLALVAAVFLGLCARTFGIYAGYLDPRVEPAPMVLRGPHAVEVISTRQVVPGPSLPPQATVLDSNNNLALVRHDGRFYFVWRTAPHHFPGTDVSLQVVSGTDEASWEFEQRLAFGTDLREPRFLSYDGRLFLYFAKLGKDRWAFEPEGVYVTERLKQGIWTRPQAIGLPGRVVWRTRVERGKAYLIAYEGGMRMYPPHSADPPLQVEVYASEDGRHWKPASGSAAAVYRGSGTETDFTFDDSGELYGVIRLEGGNEAGGSRICSAPHDAPMEWTCRMDARKFDSPLVFRHDGEVYLIARREAAHGGAFDLGERPFRRVRNFVSYMTSPMRCALWRFADRGARIDFVTDLPSKGDTCFAEALAGDRPDEVIVYDYSSPLDGRDFAWSFAQRNPTRIYRHVLRFTRR